NLVENKGRRTIEQIQQDQQHEFDRQISQASNTWLAAKMKLDPDFKKGTMKYDEVEDRYQNLINQKDTQGRFINPVRNVQDLMTLMDKAYNDVNGRYKIRNGSKPLTRKLLPGNGASGAGTKTRFEDAKTMGEAVRIGMKERGHTFS